MTTYRKSTLVAKKKLSSKQPRLLARLPFVKKDAIKATNVSYYLAQFRNWKDIGFIEADKKRLGTPRWGHVTEILNSFKKRGFQEQSVSAKILSKIFQKNKEIAQEVRPFEKTQKVLQLIARQETLLLAYRRVKKNKGALTRAAELSSGIYSRLGAQQKKLYTSTKLAPDGLSLCDFDLTSFLVLKGEYPWGTSKRIWLDKPGSTKKRPITIPPFMDRVVQEAIKMVLQAIWEPDFEKMNRSFGYRPNKSCGDALTAILSPRGHGLHFAIEGDIQGAYDAVPKDKLLSQLARKIEDKPFLDFMKKRLNYDYVDESGRHRPKVGIPQGGIDSPYLFNIHLLDLDRYIHDPVNGLQSVFDKLNSRIKMSGPGYRYKPKRNMSEKRRRIGKRLSDLRLKLREPQLSIEKIYGLRNERYRLMLEIKNMKSRMINMPTYEPSSRRLRFLYVRYADDWILLTNADYQLSVKFKGLIKDFLSQELGATLSEEKTIITDIRDRSAHFIGFELCRHRRGRKLYVERDGKSFLANAADVGIVAYPDRQRIIERMHAKGFCEVDGFPKDVPWIANLEAPVIIERYNSVIRGMLNFYAHLVGKSSLMRWIYILRFSCFKTLARKYGSSINKVYKKFGISLNSSIWKTIKFELEVTLSGITYVKEFSLLTFERAYRDAMSIGLRQSLREVFWSRERGEIGNYDLNKDSPAITQENFLDYFSWVSLRSRAPFHMPCLICGCPDNVEMHHIRHIRKSPYKGLQGMSFLRIMNLRNRKQIPVCRRCHIKVIHAGKYSGPR